MVDAASTGHLSLPQMSVGHLRPADIGDFCNVTFQYVMYAMHRQEDNSLDF